MTNQVRITLLVEGKEPLTAGFAYTGREDGNKALADKVTIAVGDATARASVTIPMAVLSNLMAQLTIADAERKPVVQLPGLVGFKGD